MIDLGVDHYRIALTLTTFIFYVTCTNNISKNCDFIRAKVISFYISITSCCSNISLLFYNFHTIYNRQWILLDKLTILEEHFFFYAMPQLVAYQHYAAFIYFAQVINWRYLADHMFTKGRGWEMWQKHLSCFACRDKYIFPVWMLTKQVP